MIGSLWLAMASINSVARTFTSLSVRSGAWSGDSGCIDSLSIGLRSSSGSSGGGGGGNSSSSVQLKVKIKTTMRGNQMLYKLVVVLSVRILHAIVSCIISGSKEGLKSLIIIWSKPIQPGNWCCKVLLCSYPVQNCTIGKIGNIRWHLHCIRFCWSKNYWTNDIQWLLMFR